MTETQRTLKIMNGNQIVDEDTRLVATANGDSHAAFIVRCCNSHDDLMAACEKWADIIQGGDELKRCEPWAQECVTELRAAIKKAEAKT